MANLTDNFNYLQPTSFKLVIDRKNFPNLEFFCQQVTHPGLIIPAAEVPVRRMQSIPFPGESLTINELSCDILLDEDGFPGLPKLLHPNMIEMFDLIKDYINHDQNFENHDYKVFDCQSWKIKFEKQKNDTEGKIYKIATFNEAWSADQVKQEFNAHRSRFGL